MGTKNAAMFAALHRDNLDIANIRTISGMAKEIRLFILKKAPKR